MTTQQNIHVSDNTLLHLYTRFLLNSPPELKEECKKNFVRIFFEIERAHWFYIDHCIDDPSVGGVDMFGLTKQLFEKFPSVVPNGINWQEKFIEWKKYRGSTATGSAIIIDEYFKMILLVQGFFGNRWSLPGGKINQNESLVDCASREVMEETGLDIENRISPNLYIDRYIGGTLRRAFIIEGLPRTSRLKPGTKNEIEAITWFVVADLPSHTQDNTPTLKLNSRPINFYLVIPFIRQLKSYIQHRLSGKSPMIALTESAHSFVHSSTVPSHLSSQSINNTNIDKLNNLVTSQKKRNKKKNKSQEVGEPIENSNNQQLSNKSDELNCLTDFTFLIVNQSTQTEKVHKNLMKLNCWESVRLNGQKFVDSICDFVQPQ